MLLWARRHLSPEILVLAALGLIVLGVSAYECLWAFNVPLAMRPGTAKLYTAPVAPAWVASVSHWEPRLDVAAVANIPPQPLELDVVAPQAESDQTTSPTQAPTATVFRPVALPKPGPVMPPPLPPVRPVEIGALPNKPAAVALWEAPLGKSANGNALVHSLPDSSFAGLSNRYDRFTAVYDLTAHTVYLPNGMRLEAHSGLGDRLDNPSHVDEPDRGATPPHLYELTQREQLFHGVQALRLNPVGGAGEIFGRAGLLAHTYMLGQNGDSNGCVSFKDYDAFLQAFQSGNVKRLAVVARLN